MRTGTSKLAKAGDMSTRVYSAKTVNEELRSLQHSCERIQKRVFAHRATLSKYATDEEANAWQARHTKLTDLLANQTGKLELAIEAALAGRVYRHRA